MSDQATGNQVFRIHQQCVAVGKRGSCDAWAAHRQEVTKACIRASGLVDARLVGSVIGFDDSVGRSAALIAGRYPHAHMARATPADDWR